jgi:hypothetical protein
MNKRILLTLIVVLFVGIYTLLSKHKVSDILLNGSFLKTTTSRKDIDSTNSFYLTLGKPFLINENLKITLIAIEPISTCGDVVNCGNSYKLEIQDAGNGKKQDAILHGSFERINVGNFAVWLTEVKDKKTIELQLLYPLALDVISNVNKLYGEIRVDSPRKASVIKSPLQVSGKANDSWFLKGVLSIILLDDYGDRVATVLANEQPSNLLNDFAAILSFNKPTTTRGWLIVKKENSQKALKIPVYFEEFNPDKARL